MRQSGTGGTLLYGIGVASGAVPVPYRYGAGTVRYRFGMDYVDRYSTGRSIMLRSVWYFCLLDGLTLLCVSVL